jgi:hypothetical protein
MIQSREPAQVAVEPAIDGKVLAGTGDDRFISVVTELAVMFANTIEKVSSAVDCRLSTEERTLTIS